MQNGTAIACLFRFVGPAGGGWPARGPVAAASWPELTPEGQQRQGGSAPTRPCGTSDPPRSHAPHGNARPDALRRGRLLRPTGGGRAAWERGGREIFRGEVYRRGPRLE